MGIVTSEGGSRLTWTLFFFNKKIIRAEIAKLLRLLKIFFLYTNVFPSWQVSDASSIKGFIVTVPGSGHCSEVHQSEIAVCLGAPSLVQTT
jgi:hypothetical protein